MLLDAVLLTALAAFAIFPATAAPATSSCKCSPGDSCWPSASIWAALNHTVDGKLIHTTPVAAPCWPGPQFDNATCSSIKSGWTDASFQANYPIGYSYPHGQSCDVPGGTTTSCSMGDSPVYAVNATCSDDVVAAVNFARQHNIRFVIKMTGHDLLGRSTGYGSLEIWLRHLRTGITFQKTYTGRTSHECHAGDWEGSAIKVGGGYSWSDVYPVAQANNVVVVGGGCPSVGAIGGYMQGGGHSLANRAYGLAADQLLEARVVLASGEIVTASPCQYQDLYTALRGGGGGTYGVVISAVIKAHPEASITAQIFTMAPLTAAHLPDFMEALAILYGVIPELNDGGLSGYGSWMAYSPTPVVGTFPAFMTWTLGAFNKNVDQIQDLFASTAKKLAPYNNTSLYISTSYRSFKTYFDYYYALNGVNSAAEGESALVSRLMGRKALHNTAGLKKMLNITAGQPSEFIFNEIEMIGGGAVLEDDDRYSGVNPAWRQSYLVNLAARGWAPGASDAAKEAAHHDITYVKGGAMTELAPDTGTYMSEGDWQDPDYLVNFYGGALPHHEAVKKKYDPYGVFYCPTCVGSQYWEVLSNGKLCWTG